jgi:hypothetical protein
LGLILASACGIYSTAACAPDGETALDIPG